MENIKTQISALPDEITERIKFIGGCCDRFGVRGYIVGGFVRDLLLGVKDFDLDIVVEAAGIDFARKLSLLLKAKLVKHKQFGTATVTAQGFKMDIATSRKETYPHPASLPDVCAGSIKEDMARRDFSINAMATSINKESFGLLYDFCGGRSDIKEKKIRVLHDSSFIDDPTRILRAIRFSQRLNFKIEPHTLRLLKQAASLKMLDKVNKQRLKDEFILLFKEKNALSCIKLTHKLCSFAFVHPQVNIDKVKLRLLSQIQKIIVWFEANFPHKRCIDSWLMYLIILLRGIALDEIQRVINDFGFKRGDKKRVISFEQHVDKIMARLSLKLKPSKIYETLQPQSYEVILLVLLMLPHKKAIDKIKDFLLHYNETKLHSKGHDLKAMGIEPGPHFKQFLKHALRAKLDDNLETKEEELHYLREMIEAKTSLRARR